MARSASRGRNTDASRTKLLDAAVHVIRSKGYSAARVEDVCAEAGLTKGAFFHHFPGKEACAVAAAAHFAANADAIFDAAPYARLPDARSRVLGYVAFRKAMLPANFKSVRGAFAFGPNQHPIHDWYALVVERGADGKPLLRTKAKILEHYGDVYSAQCHI